MLISLGWLKEYITLDYSIEEIKKFLTFSGIEVENTFTCNEIADTVITAKVIECVPMEGSDHLKICQVDIGNEIIQVVCGAPNCVNGIISVLALPGSKLKDLLVKNTRIKGIESFGMLCSEKELGLSDEHSGIIVFPPDTLLGIPLNHIYNLPDTIFDLEITPNRPDLLGYLGIATDLSACINENIKVPETERKSNSNREINEISDYLSLRVEEPFLCPRYTARIIRNVHVGESPIWLKQYLLRSGLRPINNIVDVTNYVMLETGHPLHAFDYDKLVRLDNKSAIIVRRARDKEQISALDGKTYVLNSDNLVVADAEKPIALAGIIGGSNSHITDSTVNIILEAACFEHTSIRRTAYQLKISTDSSYRFERQMVTETTEFTSIRAANMILDIAGGYLSDGNLDCWSEHEARSIVNIRPDRFRQLVGIKLDNDLIIKYLIKLGLTYLGEGRTDWNSISAKEPIPKLVKDKGNVLYFETSSTNNEEHDIIVPLNAALYFEVPSKRVDLRREADLIEEVIRLHGMDKIPQSKSVSNIMDRHAFKLKRKSADFLINKGFHEVVNLSFTDQRLIENLNLSTNDIRLQQIELLNPQNSNLSVMRTSLIPQLLQNICFNISHKMQNVMLFELNKVFYDKSGLPKTETFRLSCALIGSSHPDHWKNESAFLDFYDIKGLTEGLLKHLGITLFSFNKAVSGYFVEADSQSIIVNDTIVAEYGQLHPSISEKFNIDPFELKMNVWIIDIDIDQIIQITKNHQVSFNSIPIFPSVERDISFLIKSDIPHELVLRAINSTRDVSAQRVDLIDQYRGKQVPAGFRSLTYRIVFNQPEKTLTDDEVDIYIDLIVKNLKSQWDIQLR
jgi:phenylalanyl-tRNA synthetase beta chain